MSGRQVQIRVRRGHIERAASHQHRPRDSGPCTVCLATQNEPADALDRRSSAETRRQEIADRQGLDRTESTCGADAGAALETRMTESVAAAAATVMMRNGSSVSTRHRDEGADRDGRCPENAPPRPASLGIVQHIVIAFPLVAMIAQQTPSRIACKGYEIQSDSSEFLRRIDRNRAQS